ncbi:MAG: SDR family oxidoreductase [Dehalococcoidia bacterium]
MSRVALVSGGNRGIGGAIAETLARDGCDVAILFRKDEDSARETTGQIEKLGRKAKSYQVDVQDYEALEGVVGQVLGYFGSVDILVNNAGVASRGQLVSDTEPAEMQRVLAVHAMGPFYLSKLVVPQMRERPRGDIIFISSVASLHFGARGAPYNMGKAAMEALAKTLAKEEMPNGIHVNIVAPGLVETEMGKRLVKATTGADLEEIAGGMPFGRVCQPQDIAETVAFLCSERSAYTTGQVIYVHGGAEGGSASWIRERQGGG